MASATACSSGPDGPVLCETDADCVGLVETPYCDSASMECVPPCAADVRNVFACEDGVRRYCEDDPSLPCTVCGQVCTTGTWCDDVTETCMPLREIGEACSTIAECASRSCTPAGVCGVGQGEDCTVDTCDGACIEDNDGSTYCIRTCGTSNCRSSTAGGFDWACVTFTSLPENPAYCVPLDGCTGFGDTASPCRGFVSGECGMACPPEGCFNFCVPDSLREE